MSLVRVLQLISMTSLPFTSLSRTGPHDVTIEQAWIGRGFPDTAGSQRRGTVGAGAHPFPQRHRASLAYVVDDLKTLEKLSK